MKVAISFVDTADVAAKPHDRLRFSFGGAAAQKRNVARRCEVAIHAMYKERHFVALYGTQSIYRLNGVQKVPRNRNK